MNKQEIDKATPCKMTESTFIGSTSTLKAVYDAIDQNIFNCNLDGVQVEWCDTLKSRAAFLYEQVTFTKRQLYMRCSKIWMKNYTRKQFIEVILYEMLDLYLRKTASQKNTVLHVHLLQGAFRYLNRRFGMDLKINNNFNNKDPNNADIREILKNTSAVRRNSLKKPLIAGFKVAPYMKFENTQLVINSNLHDKNMHLDDRELQALFWTRFKGANIYAIFHDSDNMSCLLCQKEIGLGTLEAHLDSDCYVFKQPVAYHKDIKVNTFLKRDST
ncbi:uncharacterized protein LOC116346675 [Contarinia nasturtii]|uniref:uncharacterized protein LOC116346675 n=1 Tax=Contarinia nasturtii TaxID=265458 RepID=UPI0012D47275|nr:uncharacterized protein LOC116346675 [Contarinia nasturtii]